jgi:hypothetical protein
MIDSDLLSQIPDLKDGQVYVLFDYDFENGFNVFCGIYTDKEPLLTCLLEQFKYPESDLKIRKDLESFYLHHIHNQSDLIYVEVYQTNPPTNTYFN